MRNATAVIRTDTNEAALRPFTTSRSARTTWRSLRKLAPPALVVLVCLSFDLRAQSRDQVVFAGGQSLRDDGRVAEAVGQVAEAGDQVTEAGDQVAEAGDQVAKAGDQVTEAVDQVTEAGDQVANRDGRVTYVGGGAAYLDRGRLDGLDVGMTLELVRAVHAVGPVKVLHVSDTSAVAAPLTPDVRPMADDRFLLASVLDKSPDEGTAEALGAQGKTEGKPVVPILSDVLPNRWREALAGTPRALVHYESSAETKWMMRADGRASTRFSARTALGMPGLAYQEQRVSLWARGEDLGIRGLGLAVRGALDVRYDSNEDQYLPQQQALPYLREAAFRYRRKDVGVSAAIGRFRPEARLAGIVDGLEAVWQGRGLTLGVFGGLKPGAIDLAPRADNPAFGASFVLSPEFSAGRWRMAIGGLSEMYAGVAGRQAVSVDNRLVWGERLVAHQTLTLDYLLPLVAVDAGPGLDLSDATLNISYVLRKHATLEVGGRYFGQEVYLSESRGLPEDWLTALAGRSLARVDAALRLSKGANRGLEPYIYWQREDDSDISLWVLAAGVRYHRARILGAPLALEIGGDYGDGTKQQARFDVSLNARVVTFLWLSGGLLDQWTYGHDTGLHTFQHIGYFRATSQVLETFQLWALVQGAFDHDLYFRAPGGWFQGAGGLSYLW